MKTKIASVLLFVVTLLGCVHIPTTQDQLAMIESTTGYKPAVIEGATADYLEKDLDGYKLLLRIKYGDVWGRYAARVTAGEVGRELGGIWSFLTGSYKSGVGGITGSPFDRLLSDIIGQPISISVMMAHNKSHAPRLDIVNNFSTIQPYDKQPKIAYIGLRAGSLYSNDPQYARRILDNKALVKKIENFRSAYIRVDSTSVSFLFAGSETDYSGMIRDTGGYSNLLNDISTVLVALANEIN